MVKRPRSLSATLEQARQLLQEGQAQEALNTLTASFYEDVGDRSTHQLATRILEALDAPEEAALFGALAQDPSSVQALFDVGYHFVDNGHDSLAVPFLKKAHQLEKHPEIANELSLALAGSFRMQEAAQVLEEVPELDEFWHLYQRAWTRLLCGQSAPAQRFLHEAPPPAGREARAMAFALSKLSAALTRFEALGQPQPWIRDWQFVQYGSLVLDMMDERVTEGGQQVAGGRYVWQSGSASMVHAILLKLRRSLEALALRPQYLWAAPDHSSQVLGQALKTLLGLPLSPDLEVHTPTLLVAAQHHDLLVSEELGSALQQVQAQQVVFAFNLDWVRAGGLTPDIAGLLSQTFVFPWQSGLRVNPQTKEVEHTPPDQRSAAVIAAELLTTIPDQDPAFEEQLAFYTTRRQLLVAGRAGAVRLPFRRESPVPGSYFT